MGKYTIIKKYPDGGQPKPKPRKPIIVTNPNDPRLKAYKRELQANADSMFVHDIGNNYAADNKVTVDAVANEYNRQKWFWNDKAKPIHQTNLPPTTNEHVGQDLGNRNYSKLKYTTGEKLNPANKNYLVPDNIPERDENGNTYNIRDRIKPVSYNRDYTGITGKYDVGAYLDVTTPIFKKPQPVENIQQVIYQEPKQKPKKPVQPVVYQKPQHQTTYQDSMALYKKTLTKVKDWNVGSPEENYNNIISDFDYYKGGQKEATESLKKEYPNFYKKNTINGVAPIYARGMINVKDNDPSTFKNGIPIFAEPKEIPEKIFPAPEKGQMRPARITTPQQSIMPEQSQQGQIMYGPSNGAIGYMNNGMFSPIQGRDHLSKANQADIDLLNNPEALQKYIKEKPRFKYGGTMKKKSKYAVGGQEPPTFQEWLEQNNQQLLTGNEGNLYQQYQDYIKTLEQGNTLNSNSLEHEFLPHAQNTDKQGSYLEITKDPNQLDFSKGFKAFNTVLDLTGLVAGQVNDMKNRRQEKYQYEKARYPKARTSAYENGLNNSPIVYAAGGEANNVSELEKGEVFQQQDGSITKVPESHDTHEQGGSMQPFVFRVLEDTADKRSDVNSKLLKISHEEAMDMVGVKVKRPVTHSKLYEEATKYYTKQVGKIEKDTKKAVDYTKIVKDNYSKNTIDENMKNMNAIPTNGMLFDTIFNHQEEVKSKYNINGVGNNKFGGHVYDVGGGEPLYNVNGKYYTKEALKYSTGLSDIDIDKNVKSGLYKVVDSGTVPADQIITSGQSLVKSQTNTAEPMYRSKDGTVSTAIQHQQAYGWTNEELQQQIQSGNLEPIDPNTQQNTGNIKTLNAEDKAYGVYNNPNKRVFNIPGKMSVKITSPELTTDTNTATQGSNKYSSDSQISKPATPSRFNEPLHWYDVAGDIMGLIDNAERTPVPLEQLERQPLRYREQSPLPTIQQGQEDFSALTGMLPQNQIGFANQANLYSRKYSLNNQTFGQYENINKTGSSAVDNQNNANQFQLDSTDLSLRDQQQQRIMQGQATQQENKLKLFNSLFDTVAQNRALNRNGNLLMQMFPYMDQNGQFNGNKYDVAPIKALKELFEKTQTKRGAVRYVPA